MLSEKAQIKWETSWHKPILRTGAKNLTDKKFGRLTALSLSSKKRDRTNVWFCVCECGNTLFVATNNLTTGNTKSCGCLGNGERFTLPLGEASFNNLYTKYVFGAKRRNLEFSLTKEQFRKLTSSNCYLCGKEPSMMNKREDSNGYYTYNSIDRISSEEGYHINNCAPCCKTCNMAKGTLSLEEFCDLIKRIYEYNEFGN